MSAEPDHTHSHPKVKLDKYVALHRSYPEEEMLTTSSDPSGAEKREVSAGEDYEVPMADGDTNNSKENETATAILKKKKKPNSLM
jgi:hypothetical protein